MIERVTAAYEHALQCVYLDIGPRGIRVDIDKLEEGRQIVDARIKRNLGICHNEWDCPVFIGKENTPDEEEEDTEDEDSNGAEEDDGEEDRGAVNINSTRGRYSLLNKLKELGYDIPKVTSKKSTGEYETKEGTTELALQKILANNQFGKSGGDPAIRAVLKIRELGKLRNSYFNALLYRRGEDAFFLSNYNVAGTLTGRRSSKKHTFGFGNNSQNLPSHSKAASLFRRCLVPRQGNIFLFVDQIQAEDYPVSALAGNLQALQELKNGTDRHSKLASIIYKRRVPAKSDPDWNDALYSQDRYVGKKARHASNYGMDAARFSDVLAQEAQLSVSVAMCKQFLADVEIADPSVKGVFHKYIQSCLSNTRMLITPLGRERQFLNMRPHDGNNQVYKEAYAYIPQSVVADNTGFAIMRMHEKGTDKFIVNECHDSLAQDLPADPHLIYQQLLNTEMAFNRTFRFYNGIEIQIPIEAELGLSFDEKVKIKKHTYEGVKEALEKLRDMQKAVEYEVA